MFEKLLAIAYALSKKFPEGQNPFRTVCRLAEECGEVATAVHHQEGDGVKIQKLGPPNKEALVKEIRQVITAALQLAQYYQLEELLQGSIEEYYQRVKSEGLLEGYENL